MSETTAHRPPSADEDLEYARSILLAEARALEALAESVGGGFLDAVTRLATCQGSVMITGSGKAGRVGQKLADTLASTGTVSHFLHPADAVHGDLGRVQPGDVALVLSMSGETEEVLRLLPSFAELEVPIIAITASRGSSLGSAATCTLELGSLEEACSLGLAPSTSTTAMLALGDALALVVSRRRGFSRSDFARCHPGGSLGRKLAKAEEYMRPLAECRVAKEDLTVRQVLIAQGRPGRRVGAVMLLDGQGRLTGFLTDSDIARLLESGRDTALDGPARDVMTKNPTVLTQGHRMTQAVELMQRKHLSELPVVDEAGRPLGMIDRSDLDCFIPAEQRQAQAA